MEDGSRPLTGGLKCLMDLFTIELRNLEALSLAQQKMIEGIGALMQRQTEMAGEVLGRALDAKTLISAPPAGVGAAFLSQFGALKTAIVEGQARSNTLAEIAARSSGDVANILQARSLAALDELKAALEPIVSLPAKVSTPALTVQPAPVA
jgi:hypothetical protein